jgi:hypothetical protein
MELIKAHIIANKYKKKIELEIKVQILQRIDQLLVTEKGLSEWQGCF